MKSNITVIDDPEDDLTWSELALRLQSALNTNDSIEDFLHCDDDLPTESDDINIEQAILNEHLMHHNSEPMVIGSSDDEENKEADITVTSKEALECIEKLKHYACSKNINCALTSLYEFQKMISQEMTTLTQTTLDSFFCQ